MNRIGSLLFLGAVLATALFARSTGAPPGNSGVPSTHPADNNGQTCTRCHAAGANLSGGFARVEAFNYRPGQRQMLRVTVAHPEAARWGFQLTARRAGNLAQRVGAFVPSSTVQVLCTDSVAGRPVTPENPCPATELEFATHQQPSTLTGSNGTQTWDVEWIPPDDITDVVFYAAGNAANNSGNNQGDRIYTTNLSIEPDAGVRNCNATTAPTVSAVQNAASGTRDVAPNTLVSIAGLEFTPSGTRRSAAATDLRDGYPKEMACVAVEIGGVRAPLLYVSPTQINAQIPTLGRTGDMPVRVILNPGRPNQLVSNQGNVRLVDYSPALFTFDGKSVAAVHNADGVYVGLPAVVPNGRPVKPGDIVQLYATGLGFTDPIWQAGEILTRNTPFTDRFSVTVGGTTLSESDVLYVGLVSGTISGLYQINIRIPSTVTDGAVPIAISAGGVSSPAGTTIPVQR